MTKLSFLSVSWVQNEVAAKSYLKSRVSSLRLTSNEKETAVLRAAIYSLIDDGLVTKHTSIDGFTFASRSVNLTKFALTLHSRCEPVGGTHVAQGFALFNDNPSLVLIRLQQVFPTLVELTEDLINDTSSITLNIEALLPSADGTFPAAQKENVKQEEHEGYKTADENWDDDNDDNDDDNKGTPMDEDDKDSVPDGKKDVEKDGKKDDGVGEEGYRRLPSTPPLPEDASLPAIRFTCNKSVSELKTHISGLTKSRLSYCANKIVCIATVGIMFELGFSSEPREDSQKTSGSSDVIYIQRPVVLNSVFRRLPAALLPDAGTADWKKLTKAQRLQVEKRKLDMKLPSAAKDYSLFKEVLKSLKERNVIQTTASFQGERHERCIVNLPKLVDEMTVQSNPLFEMNGGQSAVAGAAAMTSPGPAAREKANLESPRVKRIAVDPQNKTAAAQTGQPAAAQPRPPPAATTTAAAAATTAQIPVRLVGLHPPRSTGNNISPSAAGNNISPSAAGVIASAAATTVAPKQAPPGLVVQQSRIPVPVPLPPQTKQPATNWSTITIINTLRAANQAMLDIKQLKDCIGVIGTPSDIRSPLSSRIDLLSLSGSTGTVWMFDFKSTSIPESREIWKLLKMNVFDPQPGTNTTPPTNYNTRSNPTSTAAHTNGVDGSLQQHNNEKLFIIVHDCRWLGPALYRQGGVQLKNGFDGQVAHGVLQVMKGIGGHGGIALPRSLENIFTEYKFPRNPKLNLGLQSQPKNFQTRPILQTVKEFIAHDTFHLCLLGTILQTSLGTEGTISVARMSRAYAETHFIENQKTYTRGHNGASSSSLPATATGGGASVPTFDSKKLPHGIPLHLTFDQARNYSATYVIAPRDMANITGGKKVLTAGDGTATTTNGTPNPNGTITTTTTHTTTNATTATNGNTSSHINNIDPALNKDVATILSLFPPAISEAVLSLRNTTYKPNNETEEMEEDENEEGQYNLTTAEAEAAAAAAAAAATPKIRWPIEILVDIGRPVTVRFSDNTETLLDDSLQFSIEEALKMMVNARKRLGLGNGAGAGAAGLSAAIAAITDAAAAASAVENPYGDRFHISDIFSSDNRAGIPGTLHRISAIRGRKQEVLGLTYRIGRHLEGIGDLVHDVLARVSRGTGNISTNNGFNSTNGGFEDSLLAGIGATAAGAATPSLLLLGPPGVGKSTLLRDVARIVADTFSKRVVVVDTSNEIAGEGSIPHACIGKARRMMVPCRDRHHVVMKEAVQNHNPDVVIIDEIADHYEVAAAKTIAQRGVALIGTAHGTSLETLLKNPELNPLVGGIQAVMLGDQAVRQSQSSKKTQLEMKGAPCFTTLIELLAPSKWRIHRDVAKSVDCLLNGKRPETELRWIAPDGRYMAQFEGGVPHAMDVGGLKAAQLTIQALISQAAGVDGGDRVAWVADLALLASRYA